jgi:hypothetical protein
MVTVFWDVTRCSLVEVAVSVEPAFFLFISTSILKLEAAGSFETFADFHQTV